MGEINIIAGPQSEIAVADLDTAPAHVRHWALGFWLQRADPTGNDAEAIDIVFLTALEQQLHAEADAERWLLQVSQRFAQAERFDPFHREACGPHAGQDDPFSTSQLLRIGGYDRIQSEAAERQPNGADIAATEVDDCQLHSTPLVLGRASPSRRTACRSARPNALKQASVL